MKIYFAGSIRGGREDKDLYGEVIRLLENYSSVLTEHISDKNLTELGETISNEKIYERDISWLHDADLVVAEVTTPSLGVGYEVAKTEAMNKKMLCIYRPSNDRKLSAMIEGNSHLVRKDYRTTDELKVIFEDFFGNLT